MMHRLIAITTLVLATLGTTRASASPADAPAEVLRVEMNTQVTAAPIMIAPYNYSEDREGVSVALRLTSLADSTKMDRVRVRVGQSVKTNAHTLRVTAITSRYVTVELR